MDMHQVHSVHRMEMEPGWFLPFHSHEDAHELVLVIDGAIDTHMEGCTGVIKGGMAKLHPRNIPHQERAVGQQTSRIILVSWSERPDCEVLKFPRLIKDRHGRLRQALEWMADLWSHGYAENQRCAQHLFEAVIATYTDLEGNENQLISKGPFVDTQNWVLNHIERPLSLDDLATQCGMSRFHFARAFRAATGQAPMTWLRAQRIAAARTLLLSTGLPLKAIASRVGFPDEFHLSRVFRRVTGQNPTQVRRLR
ncbi:MAG: AraC family transcriptional regulator [Planctomycetes bacterium]|nr:AraC family transcriptional regulator [Planctomycetota bacterium]